MKERREFVREQADWLADIYADDTIYTSPVRNLSLGGIELMRPPLWKPKENHFFKIIAIWLVQRTGSSLYGISNH